MKNGRSLVELAQEIERQNNTKKDFLVMTDAIQFDTSVIEGERPVPRLMFGDNSMEIGEIAHQQIGTYTGIPSAYYRKMLDQQPKLLATNVNTWFSAEPKQRLVRTLDSRARAFLSSKYRPIDNAEIAEMALPIIGAIDGVKVESCEITESRMYIKCVNERLQKEIVPGDFVQSGIVISNSEVGLGCVSIEPLVYRLECSNGMIINEARTRSRQVGRTLTAGEDYELYQDDTKAADDKALFLKIRDTIQSVVDEVRFGRFVEQMRTAKEARLVSPDIPNVVEVTAKKFAITKEEGKGVLDHLIRGGDLSLFGLANAVTRYSQDVTNYDRATELERIGYDVMVMPKQTWKAINEVPV